MNEIVVGVKPIAHGRIAKPGEEADIAMQAHWVTINGELLPGQVISASCVASADFLEVTIKFVASGFRTARWNGEEAPEQFRLDHAQARIEGV